jgi:hypothetical protein
MDRSGNGSRRAVVLAVVGASGGAGASTLAAACAVRAADSGRSVALVDAAVGGAGIDVVLGIDHLPGVRWPELAGCRGRVDGLGLLPRMPRAGAVAVLAHSRDSPVWVGAAAERGVIAGLSDVLDLVVVDVPRAWSLGGWRTVDQESRDGLDGLDGSEAPGSLGGPGGPGGPGELSGLGGLGGLGGWASWGALGGGPALSAVVVAGAGILELAALAATAPRVAVLVPETFVVVRGHRLSRTVVGDVEAALDLPVLGVLEHDPSVRRDLARGIPPGRGRGPLAELAQSVIEAMDQRPREVAS